MLKNSLTLCVLAMSCALAFAAETPAPEKVELPHCTSPIASVMISNLQCKAANCTSPSAGSTNPLLALLSAGGQPNASGIGSGIRDMMTTALQETGCFEIMEREAMEELAKEMAMVGKKLEVQQADFLVSGSVTQIDVVRDTTSIGGGFIPFIGSVGRTKETAAVALDLRLVSVHSAKVVASKKIASSTESSSFGIGGLAGGTVGGVGVGFGGALAPLKGTNLEAVTRDAVFQATAFLVQEARNASATKTASR